MQQQFSQNMYCMGYIGILAIRPYLPAVLRLCEVTKNNGKVNEAVLERGMIALNDSSKKIGKLQILVGRRLQKIIENQENPQKIDKDRKF